MVEDGRSERSRLLTYCTSEKHMLLGMINSNESFVIIGFALRSLSEVRLNAILTRRRTHIDTSSMASSWPQSFDWYFIQSEMTPVCKLCHCKQFVVADFVAAAEVALHLFITC